MYLKLTRKEKKMSHLTASLTSVKSSSSVSVPKPLRPMPFWLSLCLFGLPALVMAISFYFFRPWLQSLGISEFKSFLTAHIVPTADFAIHRDAMKRYTLARHRREPAPEQREAPIR